MTIETETSAGPLANGKTIALVGLMGAGKSSVGRRLADTLKLPFHDSDDEIEKAAGLSVSDIFSLHGEEEFRRVEQRVIERLITGKQQVLATGGGAFMNDQTRALLKEHAVTIWLSADLETLWRRVSRRDGRPLLKTENPKDRLRNLLETRKATYATADIVVESRDGPHMNAVRDIISALKEKFPSND
ncbi:shikimate kinase [Ponticaulis profundi]|uniref:Shikimate kinase n=1 Tax=Ponticaulis profundi TaxID=2665222 RepID=A0ABW1SA94_9PROT